MTEIPNIFYQISLKVYNCVWKWFIYHNLRCYKIIRRTTVCKELLRTVFVVTFCLGTISWNFTISNNFSLSLSDRVNKLFSMYWVTIFMKMKKNVMHLQEIENEQLFELIKRKQYIVCILSCTIMYMQNRNSFWRELGVRS